MMRRTIATVIAAACLLILNGCGPKLVTVEGTVTLDGESPGACTVIFIPEQPGVGTQATGPVDADGHFQLHTQNPTGAMPGKYKVILTKYKRLPDMSAVNVLPPIYADGATTPIHIEIPSSGSTDLEIHLTAQVTPPAHP